MKRYFSVYLFAFSCSIFLIGSCSGSNPDGSGTDPITPAPLQKEIYVCGYEEMSVPGSSPGTTSIRRMGIVWKNGRRVYISSLLYEDESDTPTGIFGADGKCYVTANKRNTYTNSFMGGDVWREIVYQDYWLPMNFAVNPGSFNDLNCVTVSGNDVYAGGTYNGVGSIYPLLWKNSTATYLPTTPAVGINASNVYSVSVSGNDVYAAGFEYTYAGVSNARLWKNNIGTNLFAGVASSVFATGSDVYVAGTRNGTFTTPTVAVLVKNGVVSVLPGGYQAKSVFVSGNDVYVAGRTAAGAAAFWKNGVQTILPGGTDANSIFVSSNDVYIAGTNSSSTTIITTAVLWKNGIPVNLSDPARNGYATGVFVK